MRGMDCEDCVASAWLGAQSSCSFNGAVPLSEAPRPHRAPVSIPAPLSSTSLGLLIIEYSSDLLSTCSMPGTAVKPLHAFPH